MTYILNPSKGSIKNKKRIGRGNGSGQGRTAGKGHNGYKSRSGTKAKLHFEGGQTPLMRRLPKRGMKIFSKSHRYKYSYQIVNISDLDRMKETKIDSKVLFDNGLISNIDIPIKILANGKMSRNIEISSNMFSETAVSKIEKAGGKVIFI